MTLADLIRRQEGIRLKPYKDTCGVLTIGIGRNLEAGITLEEAEYLLANDLLRAEQDAAKIVGPTFHGLAPARKRALESMAFQLGRTKLGMFKKMLDAVRAGDWPAAKREALNSAWAQQTPGRAQEVAEMLMTGTMPAEG